MNLRIFFLEDGPILVLHFERYLTQKKIPSFSGINMKLKILNQYETKNT